MLYWLSEYLTQYYSGFNVFSYLTFRAIISTLTALFIALYFGPKLIRALQRMQNEGILQLRVNKNFSADFLDEAIAEGLKSGGGDSWIHNGNVKVFMDGYFHADLHPGNILILEKNVLGIIDFGIVGFSSRLMAFPLSSNSTTP